MSGGAIAAVIVGLIVVWSILDLAVMRSEILWHSPDRRARTERLESRVNLVLGALCLPAIAFGITQGKWLLVASFSIGAYMFLGSYRTHKQSLQQEL